MGDTISLPTEENQIFNRAIAAHEANAIYQLALAVLWPEKTFPAKEAEQTEKQIAVYLVQADNRRHAFIAMCERILLARMCKMVVNEPKLPSQWFLASQLFGFASTFVAYSNVLNRRKTDRNYLRHIATLAGCYYRYVTCPSTKAIRSGANKLLPMGATNLIKYFHTAIRNLSYKNA